MPENQMSNRRQQVDPRMVLHENILIADLNHVKDDVLFTPSSMNVTEHDELRYYSPYLSQ
jgi:hypothetical protein